MELIKILKMKKNILSYITLISLIISSCDKDTELLTIPEEIITEIANTAANAAANAVQSQIESALASNTANEPIVNSVPETIEHSGLITSNETWLNSSIHILVDKVVVTDGAILDIQEGTVIKGRASNTPEDASALVIARGGKIYAQGTESSPIIFTAESDNINVNQIGGENLTSNDFGLWGGLIILGKARISVDGDAIESQIEGIPAEDTFGLYGGVDDTDNSGVLKYVSIRHGGANIGEGNEINGLTCGGVGTGTSISNIEVYANQDDGIDMFGGKTNITNAIVWHVGDDGFDTDQGYSGTLNNLVYIRNNDSSATESGDHVMELDGAEGSYQASNPTFMTLSNITYKAGADEIADLRDGVRAKISNLYVFNINTGADIEIDETKGSANYDSGLILFEDFEFNIGTTRLTLDDIVLDKSGSSDIPIIQSDFSIVTNQSNGQGADTSVFTWTLAKQTSNLDF